MERVLIRELKEVDISNGFLESLDSLKKASSLELAKAKEIYKKIKSNPGHIVFVAELDGKIVGSATIIIEPKFIHQGGLVGHIEDVVVSKKYQGKKIGEKIVRFQLGYAKKHGCYKTILNCRDEIKPFYEKLGFKNYSNSMRFDHI